MTRIFAAVLLSTGIALAGQPGQEQLKWGELQARIAGKKVALVLPDGTRIEGKARQVEADGLRLKISKTSDKKAQPKGVRLIPRESVSVVRVTERRVFGRLLCTIGAIGAAAAIAGAQQIDIYEGVGVIAVPAAVTAGVAGAGIGGYYVGKRLDKRVVDIRVAKQD